MKFFVSILLCILILFSCANAYACTIFSASDGSKVLAGNNEDWYDKDTYVWFLPAEEGKFGRMFFGFETAGVEGGMNEKGLFFDWVADYADHADMPTAGKLDYPGNLSEYILETCTTVEDALQVFEKYNQPTFGFATIFLADKTGDSATETWNRETKQLEITRKKPGENYQAYGYSQSVVNHMFASSPGVSVESFTSMLKAAQQSDITVYSNIYDLSSGEVTVFNEHDFNESVKFSLSDEINKGKHMYYIPSLFPGQKPGKYDEIKAGSANSDLGNILVFLFSIIFGLSLIITIFVYIPVTLFKKRPLKKGFFEPKLFSAFAHGAGAAGSALSIWILIALWFCGPFITRYGMRIYSPIAVFVPILIALIALAQIVFTVIALRHRYWPIITRIQYSFLTVCMLLMVLVFYISKVLLP